MKTYAEIRRLRRLQFCIDDEAVGDLTEEIVPLIAPLPEDPENSDYWNRYEMAIYDAFVIADRRYPGEFLNPDQLAAIVNIQVDFPEKDREKLIKYIGYRVQSAGKLLTAKQATILTNEPSCGWCIARGERGMVEIIKSMIRSIGNMRSAVRKYQMGNNSFREEDLPDNEFLRNLFKDVIDVMERIEYAMEGFDDLMRDEQRKSYIDALQKKTKKDFEKPDKLKTVDLDDEDDSEELC